MKKTRIFKRMGIFVLLVMLLAVVFGSQTVQAEPATLTVVSDTNTQWLADGTTWQPAVACWVHGSWPTIAGATWIWRTQYTDPLWEYANVPTGGWYFQRTFSLPSAAYDISGSINITADNAYYLYVNGNAIGGDGALSRDGPDTQQWKTVEEFAITQFQPGQNTILIRSMNYFDSGSSSSNPAGLVFKAEITYKEPVQVAIDIKPGSFPNSVNPDEQGLLPVAILGSDTFDVYEIVPGTIELGAVTLTTRGSAKAPKLAFSYEDVNGDGYMDMMVFFSVPELVAAGALTASTTQLTLTAELGDGTPIVGTDSVNIVP